MSFINKFLSTTYNVTVNTVSSREDWFELEKYNLEKKISPSIINVFNKTTTIADPFVFVHNKLLYVFFEEQSQYNGKGKIKACYTNNLKKWSRPKTVLDENFHLSFPFVFEDNNNVYMIPESSEDMSIRLYIADENLLNWTIIKVLFSGSRFVDTSFVKKDGTYYLFTSIQLLDDSYEQYIYFSDSLLGDWEMHPRSPIAVGKRNARNGGAILQMKNDIYRPSQDCTKFYGSKLDIYKITTLTKNEYHEELISSDIIPEKSFSRLGGHHISSTQFANKTIVVIDELKNSINFIVIWKRFKSMLSNMNLK